jgi:serine kinase of HPr protein (carbohydrate metabolism regulator)
MTNNTSLQIHATCISLEGLGFLLRGPSGIGKSDLALRMMEYNSQLIADDRVDLTLEGGILIAQAPTCLRGLLEVRGVGVIEVPYSNSIQILGIINKGAHGSRSDSGDYLSRELPPLGSRP